NENIISSKENLETELNRLNYEPKEMLKDEWLEEIAERTSINSIDDLYAEIGYGNIKLKQVVTKLRDKYHKEHGTLKDEDILTEYSRDNCESKQKSIKEIAIKGANNLKNRYAQC